MRARHGDVLASGEELAGLRALFGIERGRLAILPEAQEPLGRGEVAAAVDALSAEGRASLRRALVALGDPERRVVVHHGAGDQALVRAALAFAPASSPDYALCVRVESEWRVGLRTIEQVREMVGRSLAVDDKPHFARVRLRLSADAILAFIAIADHLRYARLVSLIDLALPRETFAAADAAARCELAARDDFRWPLNFIDKLLPTPLRDLDLARDIGPALRELEELGLIARVPAAGPQVLRATQEGGALADAVGRNVSRIGLGMTMLTEAGAPVQRTALLVRSPLDLILFFLAGREGAVRNLTANELDEWLTGFLAPNGELWARRAETTSEGEPSGAAAAVATQEERTLEIAQMPTLWMDEPALTLTLTEESGLEVGQRFALQLEGTVGRQPDCQVQLGEPGVSRRHAHLRRDRDRGWLVSDLGTVNGTFVNERRIERETPVRPGDLVRVSETRLRVVSGADE